MTTLHEKLWPESLKTILKKCINNFFQVWPSMRDWEQNTRTIQLRKALEFRGRTFYNMAELVARICVTATLLPCRNR